MSCKPFTAPGGVTGFACSRGGRSRKPCSYGGCARKAVYLCDFPVKRGDAEGTCDRGCCGAHAKRMGPDRHYCPGHAEHDAKQKEGAAP